MSQENVELLQRMAEAFNRDGWEGVGTSSFTSLPNNPRLASFMARPSFAPFSPSGPQKASQRLIFRSLTVKMLAFG
jgi:hypothetical protein